MIRIAITPVAFEAIAATMPLWSVGYEHERTASGGFFIWIDGATRTPLDAERRPGDNYSDTIIRLAGER